MSKSITIVLTPRAEAFLDALFASHEAFRADVERAHEEDKQERIRAVAESRHPHHDGGPIGLSRPIPPAYTLEEIAEKAIERGAALMLGNVAESIARRHEGMHQVHGCDPIGVGRIY
jgi:hypothetical protein